MKYNDFINEIGRLIEKGETLYDAKDMHNNSEFREWRHHVTACIDAIKKEKYDINCQIQYRSFGRSNGYFSPGIDALKKLYNRELKDTLNELNTLVDHHKKFGEPARSASEQPIARANSAHNVNVTMRWLWDNVSWKFWITLCLIMLLIFTMGIRLARSKVFEDACVDKHGEISYWCDPVKLIGSFKP
ncbi:MAG: hypothetical protein KZQ93_12775 [Candidatus Thiodiazotropha sp. (ex Monitilora ramsayi)]|nr:hypothetical protein [Candidatus Thiodiazotropha sp. (ex Monitilora ramsayi)]